MRAGVVDMCSVEAIGHGQIVFSIFRFVRAEAREKFHGALIDHTGRDDTCIQRGV